MDGGSQEAPVLADPRDEAHRKTILKLLAEEEVTLRDAPSKKNEPLSRRPKRTRKPLTTYEITWPPVTMR
jgi:hypothetical protein